MATKAFDVIIRRLATGCDFRIRVFANDWETAAYRLDKYRYLRAKGVAVFRVVSWCEVEGDQPRPLSF